MCFNNKTYLLHLVENFPNRCSFFACLFKCGKDILILFWQRLIKLILIINLSSSKYIVRQYFQYT